MDNELLARKLKELRRAHNRTQIEIADELGIVRQTYSHYETGQRTPSSQTLCKLADFYDIEVNELMQLLAPPEEGEFPESGKTPPNGGFLSEFLEFTSNPYNEKRLRRLSASEKELLFYFEKLDQKAQKEIIEFTKIKAKKET